MRSNYYYFTFAIMLLFINLSVAQKSEVFTTQDGAIRGYDPVAYFTQGKPTKGGKEFSTQWNGATWYFASRENMVMFEAAPERFAPQYGGYCAYGTSQGHKASTEADIFTIVNGKLYLNYNRDVKNTWMNDQKHYIELGDMNWPKVKSSN